MDKQQKLNYQRDVEEYLERNNIYNLFEDLTKELIISQPQNPIDFLINKLSEPECKKIFLVGPPGSEVREISLQLCDYLGFNCVSVGDLLKKEISKKSEFGQKIQEQIQQFRYVDDELVNEVVINNLKLMEDEKKNVILEGYPKTKLQALRMQKQGIMPQCLIIMNLNLDKQLLGCEQKLRQGLQNEYQMIPEEYVERLSKAYQQEYTVNINHVKQAYKNNYYEVEVKDNREEIIENIATLFKYRINNKQPKRTHKIIVAGPPGSGVTTLAKQMSQYYQLKYISIKELIAHQIYSNTLIGQQFKTHLHNQIVNDDIIINLINERISQQDCKMNGYILDGFPLNINQLYSLEDMRVSPTILIILEGNESSFLERVKKNEQGYSEQELQNKLNNWRELLKQFEERYAEQEFNPIFKVNALDSKLNVFQKVQFHLKNT